ncbi:hypothetical protein PWT90_03019 [Aphanocladium album]|nr:hypothetical protein PWT90_03019 [Aphanocladium album]
MTLCDLQRTSPSTTLAAWLHLLASSPYDGGSTVHDSRGAGDELGSIHSSDSNTTKRPQSIKGTNCRITLRRFSSETSNLNPAYITTSVSSPEEMAIPKLSSILNCKKALMHFRKAAKELPSSSIPQPLYRIRSATCSNLNTDSPSFTVYIRFQGKVFSIVVQLLELRNSPNRVREFQGFYNQLASGEICNCDSDDDEEDCQAPYTHGIGDMKAPTLPPTEPLTLKQRYASEAYQCKLKAVDDRLEPGLLYVVEAGDTFLSEDSQSTSDGHPSLSEVFPCVPLSEIEYPELDPSVMLDYEPRFVRVDNRDYLFKSYETEHNHAMQEVRKHERLSKIVLPDAVRFWRLYGIAQNHHGNAAGLLFHTISGMLLPEALERWHTGVIKGQWPHKINATVDALHANQISWGHADVNNIVIDANGDPWLTDFPTTINGEWIDMDSSTAITADRYGLESVMKYIDGRRYESSD